MFRIFNINYIFPAIFNNYSAGEGYIIIIEILQSYIKLLGIAILCLLHNMACLAVTNKLILITPSLDRRLVFVVQIRNLPKIN
jgi:hypothetical protein